MATEWDITSRFPQRKWFMQATAPITRPDAGSASADPVAELIDRARTAMAQYGREIARDGQARIDEAVTALAWSVYKPENARRLAAIAVELNRIGDLESKVIKNQRKTICI